VRAGSDATAPKGPISSIAWYAGCVADRVNLDSNASVEAVPSGRYGHLCGPAGEVTG
jgi:hypothetical protein